MRPLFLLVALVVALAAVATSCSNSPAVVSPASALERIHRAAERSTADETFRFEMSSETEWPNGSKPPVDTLLGADLKFTVSGEADLKNGTARVVADLGEVKFEMIETPDATFTRITVPGKPAPRWSKGDTGDQLMGNFLGELAGLGISDILDSLGDAATARAVGADTVRGVKTTHYEITGPEMAEEGTIEFGVWLDAEDRVRRVSALEEVPGDLTASPGAGATIRYTLELYDFGEPVDIQVPPPSEVDDAPSFGGFGTGAAPSATDLLGDIAPPCWGDKTAACRVPGPELKAAYTDPAACDGEGRRLCILPLGDVPTWQIEALRSYFDTQYGLKVRVLPALEATDSFGTKVNSEEWKVSSQRFGIEMQGRYDDLIDGGARIVAITPVDLYREDPDSFVFGVKWRTDSGDGLYGIVSTFRMNPETFGEKPDRALWFERVRKLTTKYVGILYYGLVEDEVPTSAMYRHLYGIRALDGVTGHLPVAFGAPPAPLSPAAP